MSPTTMTIPAPLAGKTAVITGGSRGIGRGIAVAFATKGVSKLAITYGANAAAAEEALAEFRKINPSIEVCAISADLESPTFAPDLVAAVLKGLSTSTIDIIVNNAAHANAGVIQPVGTATKANFDALMLANCWNPVQLALHAIPHMPEGGRVIMISSIASKLANGDPTIGYGASKAALDSYVRGLAATYSAKHGITINGVAVGPTMTDSLREAMDAPVAQLGWFEKLKERASAARRIAEVEDIAGIVAFLASDEARWINGNYVPANGGCMLDLQG
jgi:3-oxoacyl-[acyl-carrier protein] reductase